MTWRESKTSRRLPGQSGLVLLIVAALLVLWIALLSPRPKEPAAANAKRAAVNTGPSDPGVAARDELIRLRRSKEGGATLTAEQIVARRLALFSVKQRALVHKLADHYGVKVPSDVERFFD